MSWHGENPDEPANLAPPEPFGAILGVARPGVPAYSSDYDSDVKRTRGWGFALGVYTGYKYQCVEYARRWLVMARGQTFADVGMAYEIFELPYFIRLKDQQRIPVTATRNGTVGEKPRHGSVIMWKASGFFRGTGHVAIVTDATDEWVRVAEQNVTDTLWDSDYGRQLPVEIGPNGEYTIKEEISNTHVLGWLNVPEEADLPHVDSPLLKGHGLPAERDADVHPDEPRMHASFYALSSRGLYHPRQLDADGSAASRTGDDDVTET